MENFLNIGMIVVCVILVLLVLVQKKADTLNLSSMSGTNNVVKKRGPEKFLQNATIVCGVLFTGFSIALFILN